MHWSPRIYLTVIIVAVITFGLAASQSPSTGLWYAQPRALTTQPLPAFYSGGLEQGSGGQLESQGNQYDPKNLFAPSRAQNTLNGLMPTTAYPGPESCANCHAGIHAAWSSSAHAMSATDSTYLKVKEYFAFDSGEPAVRLCAGCHAPVALMTGEVGLYSRESPSSLQGVSCSFCHSVESVQGGTGAYTSNPSRWHNYLGGDYLKAKDLNLGDQLAQSLVWQRPNPHITDMRGQLDATASSAGSITGFSAAPTKLKTASENVLSSGRVCQACHSFELNGVKTQSTWEEYETSSAAKKGVTCQSCHFRSGTDYTKPEPGEVANGRARDHVFSHALGGGNTFLAPRAEDNKAYLRSALKLEPSLKADTTSLEARTLEVRVRNTGAAHAVPTGVSDLRELWLEVIALDAAGQAVFESGLRDLAGNIKPDSRIFNQVFTDERGGVLEKHEVWLARKILKDTRIPADGFRLERFTLPASAVSVKVRLLWRDVPASFAQWVLSKPGSSVPVTELAAWQSKLAAFQPGKTSLVRN
jgi:Cytochrome c554 and c-prime